MVAYPPTYEAQLFTASQRGEHEAVRSLLRGTDVNHNAVDAGTGWSALAAALIGGHGQVAGLLIDAGVDIEIIDKRGNNALHACAAGNTASDGDEVGLNVAERLLALPAAVTAVAAANHDGVTPLHLAAQRGKRSLLQLLAKAGAPLGAKDRAGRDPYHYRADAATERVLLELISDQAVRDAKVGIASGGNATANRLAATATPWNLADPGRLDQGPKTTVLQHAAAGEKNAPRTTSASGAFAGAAPGYRAPALTIGPPAPPYVAPGKYGQPRSGDANSLGRARTGRTLTAAEERRASYLNIYFSDAGTAPEKGKKPQRAGSQSKQRGASVAGGPKSISGRSAGYGLAPAVKTGASGETKLSLEDKLRRAFKAADSDGSKSVSKRELFKALEKAVRLARYERDSNGAARSFAGLHGPSPPSPSLVAAPL